MATSDCGEFTQVDRELLEIIGSGVEPVELNDLLPVEAGAADEASDPIMSYHWEWWNAVQKNTKSLDFERLVPLLSNAARKAVSDCVKLLSNSNEGHKILVDAFVSAADKSHDDNLNGIWLSDWSKFGFYDIDFGFGKLIWTSVVNVPVKNFITMFNTKDNHGIEAWVNLHEKYMPYFEQDEEIKKLTT
ncbi:Acyltransferase ACT6 [Forsythia ovata]|uniref:Acyltransferase ACT6 n=1 Tax=Forsythia ovata TaxID=205694 RepID=A0ABD1S3M1_9LAMI